MQPFSRPVSAGRRASAIRAVLLLVSACQMCSVPAGAAQLLALPPDSHGTLLAVATWSAGDVLLLCHRDGSHGTVTLPGQLKAEALVWTDGSGLVVFGGGRVIAMSATSEAVRFTTLGSGPHQVRAAVEATANSVLLASGGRSGNGAPAQAQASLWQLLPRPRKLWDGPGPRVNPRCLATGTLAGRPCLLIGVDKTAIFDPILRMRPWIYHLHDATPAPLWKGTSFSQPFLTAIFADISPHHPHDEICSLELAPDRKRQITAYRWHGFVMEGIAQTAPADYGDQLRQVRSGPGHPTTVCVWEGGARGRILGLAVEQWPQYQVAELQVCCATETISRPVAWDVGWAADGPAAYALTESGSIKALPLSKATDQ